MAKDTPLDDDEYIARLLAEDARKSSVNYARTGLSALLPGGKKRGDQTRVNTRFLRNIVKEAEGHNAALKRKEEVEARSRVRGLRGKEGDGGEGTKSRRRGGGRREDEGRLRRNMSSESESERESHAGRSRDGQYRHEREEGNRRRHRILDPGRNAAEEVESSNPHKHRSTRRYSSRSRSPDGRHRHKDADYRSSGRRDERPSSSDRVKDEKARRRHRHEGSEKPSSEKTRRSHSRSPNRRSNHRARSRSRSASSDPLESLVGPLPSATASASQSQPRVRGRGRGSSTIDQHFSSTYDPSQDVRLEDEAPSEREDWDMALEALRDRTAWKAKQAERLREAGFGDEEIKKWEDGARDKERLEGDVADVKWKRRGEVREWDLGKVDQDDGESGGESRKKRRKANLEDGWKVGGKGKDGRGGGGGGGGLLRGFRKALG